jgi:hypothetical protein
MTAECPMCNKARTVLVVAELGGEAMIKRMVDAANKAGHSVVVVDSLSGAEDHMRGSNEPSIVVTTANPETPVEIVLRRPQNVGISDGLGNSGPSGQSGPQPKNSRNWLHGNPEPWKRKKRR